MAATGKRSAAIVVKSMLEVDKKVELIGLSKYSRSFERVWIVKNGLNVGTDAKKALGAMLMEECRSGLGRVKYAVIVARLVAEM